MRHMEKWHQQLGGISFGDTCNRPSGCLAQSCAISSAAVSLVFVQKLVGQLLMLSDKADLVRGVLYRTTAGPRQ